IPSVGSGRYAPGPNIALLSLLECLDQNNTINVLRGPPGILAIVSIYVIDSLPIAVWDNIRIRRSKMYSDEHFRGYQASKQSSFYGLKIHLRVTQAGQPVECFLTHGGFGDVDALKYYAYELPDGSIIYDDKAYN